MSRYENIGLGTFIHLYSVFIFHLIGHVSVTLGTWHPNESDDETNPTKR